MQMGLLKKGFHWTLLHALRAADPAHHDALAAAAAAHAAGKRAGAARAGRRGPFDVLMTNGSSSPCWNLWTFAQFSWARRWSLPTTTACCGSW
jgi:hypothetical protein